MTKVMRINTSRTEPIRLGDNEIEDVTSSTYLGSIVDTSGGTDQGFKIRRGKARTAYILLRKIWNSQDLSRPTKIRIFNSNLFYGAETLRTNVSSDKRVQSFISKCLHRILRIWWQNCINNKELWQQTNQLPPPLQIRKRKWTWIGHTLRKDPSSSTRQAFKWNPQGKRRRGRPRNTWRRSVEDEMSKAGHPSHACSDGTEQSQMERDCQWPMLCTRVKMHK